ncbi:MAG: PEPxxWA-CTERM sorting domain-containing protein [Sphingomonadaceae bacterium]
MLKTGLFTIALASALIAPSGAQAAVTFTLSGNSAVNGAHGNAAVFTGSDGTTKVRASAWSISGNTVYDSYLGVFGSGLGATSGDDGNGSSSTHTVDNHTRRDFILLQFNTSVKLDSANFATYSVLGNGKDSDATIAFGTTASNWMAQPALDNANVATLNGLFNTSFTSLGTASGGTRNLNAGGYGNLWLVGAAFINDDRAIDAFKLGALKVTPGAVPEPATWAMMISGFGLIGGAMRMRRTASVSFA